MTEYEYYSNFQKCPNTNIIQLPKNDRIRVLFVLSKRTKYEYTIQEALVKYCRVEI